MILYVRRIAHATRRRHDGSRSRAQCQILIILFRLSAVSAKNEEPPFHDIIVGQLLIEFLFLAHGSRLISALRRRAACRWLRHRSAPADFRAMRSAERRLASGAHAMSFWPRGQTYADVVTLPRRHFSRRRAYARRQKDMPRDYFMQAFFGSLCAAARSAILGYFSLHFLFATSLFSH